MQNFNDPMSHLQYQQQFPQYGQTTGVQNASPNQGANPALTQSVPDSFQKEGAGDTKTSIAVGAGIVAAFAAITALVMRKPAAAAETIAVTEKTVNHSGGFFKKIGNFFGKIGKGIKKGFKNLFNFKFKTKKTNPANSEKVKKDGFFKKLFNKFKRTKKKPETASENNVKKEGFFEKLKKSFKRKPKADSQEKTEGWFKEYSSVFQTNKKNWQNSAEMR